MIKKKKRSRYILLSVLLLICGIAYALYQAAPYLIIKPRKVQYDKHPSNFGMNSKDVTWQTEDSLTLKGWATFPEQGDSMPVILFLHGIGNSKESWVSTAKWLYAKGYASVAFDGRAHGASEGEFCTFGFYEKRDVARIIDWIEATYPNCPIGIWGNSLGGAIALQALAYDDSIDFGVVTSTFADLSEVVLAYQKRYFLGWESPSLAADALFRASEIADFEPVVVRPEHAAETIEQPVFLAHGTADARIDVSNAHRIFEALASDAKELRLVDGAGHKNMWIVGGAAYKRDIDAFLEKQIHTSAAQSLLTINEK